VRAALSQTGAWAYVPTRIVSSTIKFATLFAACNTAGVISCQVVALTEGILKTMLLKKIMTTAMVALALGLAPVIGGALAVGQVVEKPARIEKPMDQPPIAEQKPTNPVTQKKPMDTAPEKKQVLKPDEAIRMAEDSKVTVEFKVQFVTKAVLVKSDDKKVAGWVNGHGPGDICLRPQAPTDRKQARFLAILTEKAIKQFNKVGIQDIAKHFSGKIVRVTGRITRIDYDGLATPSEIELVIDDLSQLEVVN
jgi:hypothetical protein